MKRLVDQVSVARRFQRSIRIDSDLGQAAALDGFICPPSSVSILQTMAKHVSETGQCAFTWTGPYGSGKSSLIVALGGLLSGSKKLRDSAMVGIGEVDGKEILERLAPRGMGWRVVPVVGRRESLAELIGRALEAHDIGRRPTKGWRDEDVLERIEEALAGSTKQTTGIMLVIDELGKALEGAAQAGHDIYLLQQLAEMASRSERRLIIVGVLHQSFDEYARRLPREARDEWSKVQGRFVDLVVNASGEEQLELLARAIEVSGKRPPAAAAQTIVAALMRPGQARAQTTVANLLGRCWPLHPVVAGLLGPISRRRFGQNQRSLFAFLNSAETYGFQSFLADSGLDAIYQPDRLWDYLNANLEPAILASTDGHRWATGLEAIERCRSGELTALEVALLKTIILIDLFRERSGLVASEDLLVHCVSGASRKDVQQALKRLTTKSCIVLRRHIGGYAVFAGSDFDVELALSEAMPPVSAIDLKQLRDLAGLQPILIKRHYHRTGTMRWFTADFVALHDLANLLKDVTGDLSAAGRFLVVFPMQGESFQKCRESCAQVVTDGPDNVMVGMADNITHILELAREVVGLSAIHDERPELRGDAVARREILARLGEAQARLVQELKDLFGAASWFRRGSAARRFTTAELNSTASDICDVRYASCPLIHNELLNRDFPSSNAVKAQRELMKRMLSGEGLPRLGIEGWPAEGGLLESILLRTGLYRERSKGKWEFGAPHGKADVSNMSAAWQAALKELKRRRKAPVSLGDIFDVWRRPPIGLKEGVMPVLALALYLTNREHLAAYRQGVFKPELTELDVDLLTNDPKHVELRWVELGEEATAILLGLGNLAARLDPCGRAVATSPLEVARMLVAAYDRLPPWTKRTTKLSPAAQKLAAMLRYAADPNRLLFEDVPQLGVGAGKGAKNVKETIGLVTDAFKELNAAYAQMLMGVEEVLLSELQARPGDYQGVRARAANLLPAASDLRLKAFIQRLTHYDGEAADTEGVLSLALEKKPADWADADVTAAKQRLGELAQSFKRIEEVARVSGRPDSRHRMAVIVPREGQNRAMHTEFVVNAHEREDVQDLILRLDQAMGRLPDDRRHIVLAALAELSSRYMGTDGEEKIKRRKAAS